MSVTDGDRKRARAILAESTFGIQVNQAMAVPRIAQALADERERAQEAFLHLATFLERPPLSERESGQVSERTAAFQDAAAAIRRVAGDPT